MTTPLDSINDIKERAYRRHMDDGAKLSDDYDLDHDVFCLLEELFDDALWFTDHDGKGRTRWRGESRWRSSRLAD